MLASRRCFPPTVPSLNGELVGFELGQPITGHGGIPLFVMRTSSPYTRMKRCMDKAIWLGGGAVINAICLGRIDGLTVFLPPQVYAVAMGTVVGRPLLPERWK